MSMDFNFKSPGLIAVRGNFPTFYGFHSHKVAPTKTSTQYNMIKYLEFGLLDTKRTKRSLDANVSV